MAIPDLGLLPARRRAWSWCRWAWLEKSASAAAGLARGYLGRPELTAERFVPDPFGDPGERLYRSGDLARYRPDGQLDYLGRRDQQVKVRGFRIEPGEIEAALLAHGAVRSAAVLPRQDASGGGALVAYLETARGAVAAGEIRKLLEARLPEHMIPAAWVFVESMPLTANGKLDRRALAALPLEPAGDADPGAPRTPTEELVAGIFATVLGVERVGPAADFFALGGHSLLATQVASRVRAVLGVELPVRTVFVAPTVAGLASWLDRAAQPGEPGTAIPRLSRDEPPGLSFAQQRLWFLDRLEPGSPLYNIPVAVELTGRLDRAALAAALGEVVRRHEALRTTFREAAGEPVQVIAEPAGLTLPLIDLAGCEAVVSRLAQAEARRPFDLGRGPLLRALLLRAGAERHVLLLTMHHIVSDGWSIGVLVREVATLYAAFAGGAAEPAARACDPVRRLRRLATAASVGRAPGLGARLVAREARRRRPPWSCRRTGRGRPQSPRARSGSEFVLGHGDLAGLKALSRRRRGDAVHDAARRLHRARPALDRRGRPGGRARRPRGGPGCEAEPLIGLFVNTLVLRTDLSGEPPFAELLARVREATLGAYAHQELPFERLVEALAPERDLSRPPLVQVLFTLQNAPLEPLDLPGLAVTASAVSTGTAKFELSCALTETDGRLAGTLEHDRDLFDATTAFRLADGFARLLAAAAAAPEAAVGAASAERRGAPGAARGVVRRPRRRRPLSSPRRSPISSPGQAAERPAAEALTCEGETLSYGELDRRANRLARFLRELGVAPEVPVGLLFERGVDLVAALLAVVKAGGAYVPLDPDYPEERLAFLLEDSAAAVLLTEEGPEPLAKTGGRSARVLPENLAYLIYTSGSTGRPKGVAIEHRSAVAFARWAHTVFAPEDFAGVLAATSVSFDLSVFELFVTLAWGGTVILAANALELPHLAAAGEVTLLNTVPSAMAELVRQRAVPASVRTVNLAGEPLKRSLVDAIYESTSASRVLDLYGPSEATTYSTWAPAPRDERREPAIGRPIAGTRAVLLGRSGELVPVGAAGELCLGGAGLARGYFNRSDLTADGFVPDPFAPEPGGRLYRTGDLARWLPDGRLDYLGRIDQQVKVRGFRIELGEVEAALLAHGQIQEAAVLAVDGSLVAFVVAAAGEAAEAPALRSFLRKRLPEFMVPSAWRFLPSLPLTPNGKVDKKALAQLRPERTSGTAEAPRTPAEELVAGIFAEVLKAERIGVTESFFDLGGQSLLATRVASRVGRVFGVELPVRAVFEAPTVEGLAAWIEGSPRAAEPAARIPRISARSRRACRLRSSGSGSWTGSRRAARSTTSRWRSS